MRSTWFVYWRELPSLWTWVVGGVAVLRRTPYSVLGAAAVVDDLDGRVSSQFVLDDVWCVIFGHCRLRVCRHQRSPLSRRYRSSTATD